MNKLIATLAAVAALSTAALAASDDHGRDVGVVNSGGGAAASTQSLVVKPVIRDDRQKEDYLNWNQLR